MRIWNKNIGTAVIDLIDPCGIDSNGGFHADHSLVAGRAAGCGHCPDAHARHLTKKRKRPEKPVIATAPLIAPPSGGAFC
jgi:AhpD family alkylhydroperoxidase